MPSLHMYNTQRYKLILANSKTIQNYISMLGGYNICDRAWENRSYLHVKFDLILRVYNVIKFYL